MTEIKYSTRNTKNVKLLEFNSYSKENHTTRNTKIVFETSNRVFDIGSLAFQARVKEKNQNGTRSYENVLVDISSLNISRENAISILIEEIQTRVKTGKIRDISAESKTRCIIEFIDWCDSNGCSRVMDDVKSGLIAYKEYSTHLEQRVRTYTLSLHSAAINQENARFAIATIFKIESSKVSHGTRFIRRNINSVRNTTPPSDADVSEVLSLCSSFFTGACDFLLNDRKFPFKIKLSSEEIWLLPTKPKFCATKEYIETRENWGMGQWAWNFEHGTINSHLDIAEKYDFSTVKLQIAAAKQMILNAKSALKRENNNQYTLVRQKIASLANNCFIVLFFANTGMNLTQARELAWSDDYSLSSFSIEFKTVKFRANGKDVEFVISSKFIETFKKYTQLRKYILEGSNYPFLLFSKESRKTKPKQLPIDVLRRITRGLRRTFYSKLKSINTREWRAKKSDFLIRTSDISTTALILQNTEATVTRSYIVGSEHEYSAELSQYWTRLNELVTFKRSIKSGESIAVGSCKNPNTPVSESKSCAITPDCRQPEGCLFCDQFAVHADEQDLRKLHSLSYVINECMPLAKSIEHHSSIFGEILKRINLILGHISSKSEELEALNEKIKNDVFKNENLTPYWSKKISMLVAIGAL